jgi:nucleotide-binding universal stress UspA family protein
MSALNRILVPVDFSSCSYAACDLATKYATTMGASVELLHVQEPPAWQGFVIPELVVSMPDEASTSLHEFVETRTQRALDQLMEKLERAGVIHVHHRQEAGEPGAVIVRIAEEERFDLIVMGTHGRKGFERLVMGSVAERVVRHAPCPVLTVRAQDEAVSEKASATQGRIGT